MAGITTVGSWVNAPATASTTTKTINKNGTTAGNFLVVTLAWWLSSGTSTLNSVKDGAGNSFTILGTTRSSQFTVAIAVLFNIPGGNTTITATFSLASECSISMREYSPGAGNTPAVDGYIGHADQTPVSAFASGNLTPTTSSDLAVGVHTHGQTGTTTATSGSGFTIDIGTEDNAGSQSLASEDQILSSASPVQAQFTLSISDTGATALGLFKAPAAAPGAMAATLAASTTVSGTITGAGALSNAIATSTTAGGTIRGAGALSSTIAASTTVNGTIAAVEGSSTTIAGIATAGGAIFGTGALRANIAATATAGGAFTVSGSLWGVIAAATTARGVITGSGTLSATSAGLGALSAMPVSSGASTGAGSGYGGGWMPALQSPGVYLREAPAASLPIAGISTTTAAFVGITDKGPVPGTILPNGRVAQPVLVTSFTQYARQFGGFRQDSFLTYAVQAFFRNSGQSLYIVRVVPSTLSSPPSSPSTTAILRRGFGRPAIWSISAANPGQWGNNIWVQFVASSDGDPNNFALLVLYGPTLNQADVVESYDSLTYLGSPNLQPGASAPATYARLAVNNRSEYIAITSDFNTALALPVTYQLTGGSDGATSSVNFIGTPAADNSVTGAGLFALDKITNVSLLAIPGQGDIATVNAGVEYCKNRPQQDCFFIGDVGSVQDTTGATNVSLARFDSTAPTIARIADARAFMTNAVGTGGVPLDRSSGDYGAVYFPWLYASDPIGSGLNSRILLPPSGFVAGIYARMDNSRGVFKAPAGNEAGVAGAVCPYVAVSDAEQDQLNPIMVNAIRTVPGSGLVLWGSRTFSSDASWRYVPVRRMAIFLRVSIYNGIQWAVFQPNDETLWSSLRLSIRAFMLTQFRAGAFQGSTPDAAFFVKCDSSTTTQTDVDNGVVNILVGFAPLKPAEFVVLKLSQKVNQPTA